MNISTVILGSTTLSGWLLVLLLYNTNANLQVEVATANKGMDTCQIERDQMDERLIELEADIRAAIAESKEFIDRAAVAAGTINELEDMIETLNDITFDLTIPVKCEGAMNWLVEKAQEISNE